MNYFLSISVVVMGCLVIALLGSQVEMYRNIELLRKYSGMIDESIPIEIEGIGAAPSEVGLPRSLDNVPRRVVLFLSNRCSTCRAIASDLSSAVPAGLTVVVDPPEDGSPANLAYNFGPEATVLDNDRRISRAIKLQTTPTAVLVVDGRLDSALSVPSTRRLREILASRTDAVARQ